MRWSSVLKFYLMFHILKTFCPFRKKSMSCIKRGVKFDLSIYAEIQSEHVALKLLMKKGKEVPQIKDNSLKLMKENERRE